MSDDFKNLIKIFKTSILVVVIWLAPLAVLGLLSWLGVGLAWVFIEGDGGGPLSDFSLFLMELTLENVYFHIILFVVISALYIKKLKVRSKWPTRHLQILIAVLVILIVSFIFLFSQFLY